jgi:hypothetical protein
MVSANNCLTENTAVLDGYLRSLHDFRVGTETALLPVIDYFISLGSSTVDSGLLTAEQTYLENLARKYYKRPFSITLRETDQSIVDALTKLIRKSRHAVEYSLSDAADFLAEQQAYLADVPLRIAEAVQAIAVVKHHKQIDLPAAQKTVTYAADTAVTPFLKYETAEQLYVSVLSNVKRAIDFDVLRLYDFLLESPTAYSTKVLECKNDLISLATQEYGKQVLGNSIHPSTDPCHRVLDEWGSHTRRILELRYALKEDVKKLSLQERSPEVNALLTL